jgi:uncharacterized membrane protein YfcA
MPSLPLIFGAAATGAAAGLLGGLFGIGGGVIAIPLLGLLFGLDQRVAQGTTLVMVAPNVLLGFWRYWQHGGIDLRIAAALAVSAGLSTYPAALFATGFDPMRLRLAFAAFLMALAVIVAAQAWRAGSRSTTRPRLAWGWSVILGIIGGLVSGVFGVGGAFIAGPALTAFFGCRQAEAQGLALALVAPGTIVAVATYAGAGQVEWGIGIPLAIGGLAAISAGVAGAHRLPDRALRLGFCGIMAVTAVLLVLRR